jgi:hypothetical protein
MCNFSQWFQRGRDAETFPAAANKIIIIITKNEKINRDNLWNEIY